MKFSYSKPLDPRKLQKNVVEDLEGYLESIKKRVKKYSLSAKVVVDCCYICNSRDLAEPILKVYGFSYLKCDKCGHVFTSRRLSQTKLNAFYKHSKAYAKTYTSKEQLEYRIANVAKPKVDYVFENIKLEKGSWLDIGSAIGDIVYEVGKRKGWKATGVEISSESVSLAKSKLKVDVRQQLFKQFSSQNSRTKFDVISFFGYLEVISDPMVEVELAMSHLKHGGFMVIGEANADSLSTLVQQSYPQYSRRHLLPPTVIQQFTLSSLKKLARLVGLKPVSYWSYGLDYYEFLGHMALMKKGFNKTPVFEFMMNNLDGFQEVVDKKLMGDNMMMIAQKK